jgi:N12 class adenine-specific DNA methylase
VANLFDRDYAAANRTPYEQIEGVARKTRVPVNILLAIGEKAGVKDGNELVTVATRAAEELGPVISQGGDIKAIIREMAGDEADSFLARARQIGQDLYPQQFQAAQAQRQAEAPAEPGMAGNLARSFGGGLASGVGAAVEGLGGLADAPLSVIRGDENYQPGMLARAGRAGGDALRGLGENMRAGMSQDARDAIQQSMPEGDIFKPETWSLGESTSLKGLALLTADVLGSFAPVVAAAAVSGGAGLAIGAAQSAGSGSEMARGIVEEAFADKDAQGVSALERESSYFRELRAAGMDEAQALETTKNAAGFAASLMTAPIGALGGAATSAIIKGALPAGVGTTGGIARQAAVRGAIGAGEEGFQEALEGVAARYGTQVATDMPIDLTQDTFGDFLLGALGGGPVGAAAGAGQAAAQRFGGGQPQEGEIDPTLGADGTVTPPQPAQQGAMPPEPRPGTLSHAALEGARRSGVAPQPDTGPVMVSPATGMPGGEPLASEGVGQAGAPQAGTTGQQIPVIVRIADGTEFQGEIIGQTETGVEVMDPTSGEVYEFPQADMEAGFVEITPMDAAPQAAPATEAAPAPQMQPSERPAPPAVRGVDDAAAEALREQGFNDGPWNDPQGDNLAGISAEEALRRLSVLEGQARQDGWNKRSRELRDRLMLIAGQAQPTPAPVEAVTPPAPEDAAPLGELGAGTQGAAAPASPPTSIAKPDGTPFKARGPLVAKIRREGLDPDTYDIQERDGGFVAVLKGTGATDAAIPDGVQAGDQSDAETGNAIQEAGEEGAPLAGQQQPDPVQPPAFPSGGRDLPDATETGQLDAALNVQQNETQPTPTTGETDGIQQGIDQQGLRDEGRGQEEVAQTPARPAIGPMDPERAKVRRRETNAVLDAIEAGSNWQGTLDGRTVIVRPGKARVRVDGQRENDIIFDTEGMARDEVETYLNGAIDQAERRAPSVAGRDPVSAALAAGIEKGKVEHVTQKGKTLTGYVVRGITDDQAKAIDPYMLKKNGGHFVRADRADMFEGMPKAPAAQSAQSAQAEPETPTAEQFDQVAAQTNPNPTPAQAEAENYKTGKTDWRGLTLSVENRKGSVRSKMKPDGTEAWSVTMPAHYGRILRTEGADGDHVDFYMGDDPDSDRVFVVDQMDAETGKFDEHKVMLGFPDQQAAKAAYLAGFSDGKGKDRWGGVTPLNVKQLSNELSKERAFKQPFSAAAQQKDYDAKLKPAKARAEKPVPIKPIEIPAEGFLRPGYERVMVNGEPSTDQTRMTDDGYVVVRQINKTTIRGPQGQVIWAGAYDVNEATVDAEIGKARDRRAKDAPKPKGWQQIGTNARGKPLFEDERGVRSYTDGGVRLTESVGMQPTREGGMRISVNEDERGRDYLTKEEWGATNPEGDQKQQAERLVAEANEKAAEGYRIDLDYGRANVKTLGPDNALLQVDTFSSIAALETAIDRALNIIQNRSARKADSSQAQQKPKAAEPPIVNPEHDALAQRISDFIGGYPALDRIREQARIYGFENLAFEFRRDAGEGRRDSIWVTGTGKVLSVGQKSKPKAIRDGVIRDTLSSYTIVPASWKPESLFGTKAPERTPSAASILDQAFDDVFGATDAAPEPAPTPEPDAPAPNVAAVLPEAVDAAIIRVMEKKKERVKRLRAANSPKLAEAEQDMRRARQTVFEVEEAAAQALAAGDPSLFDRFAGAFPDAAEAIRDEIPSPAPRTAGQAASSAAQNIASGASDIVAGLNALFGDPNKLGSGLSFDAATYEKAKPLFISAVRKFGQAGQDIMDIARAMVRGLMADGLQREAQQNMRPYLERFITDVQSGAVDPFAEGQTSGNVGGTQESEAANDQRRDEGTDGTSPGQGDGDPAPRRGQADATRRASDEPGGAERGLRPDGDGRPSVERDAARDGATGRAGRTDQQLGARDHIIEAGGLTLARGEKTRARESIAALRVLRTIQAEGRPATADERVALAKYGGAGTLAGTLPRSDGSIKFPDLAADIDALLDAEEKATLSRTSQYAFYTAESALRGMWSIARQIGFNGGRVYEPGMGVGGFAGTIPADVRDQTSYQGLELDLVTAQIAQALYPRQAIQQGDFTKTPLPQNFYDLVIGNPPFSATKIQNDPAYPQRFMIHDYFFAKSLDAVRPGGLLMFITSAGTMNKSDTSARDYLADRADLVGAIRLPNTAFKENGTEVTTDIIILRKRMDGEAEANPTWRESVKADLPDGEGGTGQAFVNRYFLENPGMILGEQGLFDTLTAGARVGVRPLPNADLAADLARAAQSLPRDIMSEAAPSTQLGAIDSTSPETKRGGFYIKDGVLHQFDGNAGVEVAVRSKENTKGVSKADHERIMALVPVKMALRDVYAADLDGKDATAARKALNETYDAFVEKFGPINKEVRTERRPSRVQLETARQRASEDARSRGEAFDIGSFDAGPMIEAGAKMSDIARARADAMERPDYREGDFNPDSVPDLVIVKRPNIEPFLGNADRLGDQEGYRLRAIEKYNEETGEAKKTPIFTEPAVRRSKEPEINSPEDALLYSLAERGRINIAAIAKLAKVSEDSVLSDLQGKIFRNPATNEYETRAKYLSGNVRRKLAEAQFAATNDPSYSSNVRELLDVQPEPIPASDIRVPVGAHWFDPAIYGQYARSKGLQLTASFKPSLGIWTVDGSNTSAAARNDWGTEDIPFADLMRLVMNNKTIQVRRTHTNPDGSKESRLDEEATQAAQDKAREIREDFAQWFWSDETRAEQMEALYNETFNAEVAPKYDGGYLTTPGVNSAWSWRPHQSSVIARILQSGNTYMAHTVGAGKTSAMIGAGMEARRLGLARKPMYVVPNHMLDQFSKEFYEQYPLANVAIADESRFHTSRRKEFVADIAMNDYDAVVITHSAFELIPPSEAAVTLAVQDMLQDVREVYDSSESGDRGIDQALLGSIKSIASSLGVDVKQVEGAKMNTRKKIEQLLEAAEQRIQRQTSSANKDQVFTFDEIGVDMMFVDEAHLFRKLSFATQNGNIKGIDPNGSAASMDLFIKTRVVDRNNPGRGLILASGTPITNTMAELFSLSRYIQPQALADRGVSSFDAWAATFGMTETALEQDPAGGYKQVTRFSRFVNTPELSLMVRQIMDIVSGPDLEQYVTRPKLKGGKRNLVVVDPTPEVKAFQMGLAARMEMIASRKGPVQKGDDILLSVINDGRLAAIDMRLVNPSSSGQGSKLEMAIQNIYRKWKVGADAPLHGVKKEGGYTDQPIMRGPSTQIVFSTLGVNPSKHNPGFSVHRFIKSELIRMGVPADDIVLADDLNSHGKRQRAFNDMNEGKKRILIGSKTLFTGVNAQKRIAAIHNLDPLWYPADDEQRNGRGIRQGNMNPEIEIFDYSTKATYDATMWQMMGRKAAFIEAFYRGDPTVREMEDLGEASQFEQAKAMTTADPRVQVLTDMKAERDTLRRRKSAAEGQKRRLDQQERNAERAADLQEAELPVWEQMAERVQDTKGDLFKASVQSQEFDNRTEAGNALISAADVALADPEGPTRIDVGAVGGFPIQMRVLRGAQSTTFVIPIADEKGIDVGWTVDPVGLMRRLENAVQGLKDIPTKMRSEIDRYRDQALSFRAARERLKQFGEQSKLDDLEKRIDDLESEMLAEAKAEKESRFDPDLTPALTREVTRSVNAEMKRSGLDGKVTAQVVKGLVNAAGRPIQGRQRGATIEVNPDSADGVVGTLRHEIVHALRDGDLWGKPYGLFTQTEWQGLVAAARRDADLMDRINSLYPDLGETARLEEGVAELYRLWARNMDQRSGLGRAFQKMRAFFEAMASALRGQGFTSTALTFERIASGSVGGRGPDGPQGGGRAAPREAESRFSLSRRPDGRFATKAGAYSADLLADGGPITGAKERTMVGRFLTDMMGGKSDTYNLLALAPGEPLFQELGKDLQSAQKYLKMKHAMSAMRNERQANAADLMDEWRGFMSKNQKSNMAMMELMHDATIAGVDPAERFVTRPKGNNESKAAYAAYVEGKRAQYDELKERFDRIPKTGQAIYRKVRDAYMQMAEDERSIIMDNVQKAMELNLKRAQQRFEDDMREIDEDGLTGDEREAKEKEAKEKLARVKKVNGYGRKSRMAALRLMFEQNSVDAPYFPLLRHGNYYVTVKNSDGKVISFTKAESEKDQQRIARELARDFPDAEVKVGVMSSGESGRAEVDPTFVADVEAMIGASVADPQLMDAIWQRYLETLPDFSIRKSRLHRKGTPGYTRDAFRNYARQMFHGAHQLARLKYGQDMQMALDDARREADEAADPNRAVLVVNEMFKRHEWTMNPQNAAWSTWATSAAFVYYLGATPAAALVNLSQSVVVGIPVLAAAFEKGTIAGAARHLGRGLREFAMGKGGMIKSKSLKPDEREALQRAYDAGVIEKSQAHDLAGIADSGVEYSDIRARIMRPISWMFHQAEVLNREITFMAAYRMARENGRGPDQAYADGARLTWKTHFNYENDARPRLQFNDTIRVATTFKNFQLNMLFRLFRDTHQVFEGATEAERKEARAQLIGITGMMMLMAGFTGTWGYALMTTLVGMFFPGGADEVEEEIKGALVNVLGRDVAGMILKGVPGHLTGVDLSSRIGMPELWFRRPDRMQEGQDLYNHWIEQLLGPVVGIGANVFRGADMMKQGEVYRGVETAVPKAIRDLMRATRYSAEGVTTFNGNPIIQDVAPTEALTQALGFTPARISERYETNRFMKNEEMRIRGERTRLMAQAYEEVKAGTPLSDRTKRAIDQFNAEYPSYPITADTLRQSFRSRARGEVETVDGVRINSRLDAQIRSEREGREIYQ